MTAPLGSVPLRPNRPGLAHVRGLDHVVIRVGDLDAAEARWRRLGFALTPRGFHVGRGSANHTTPFAAGNYIELIQIDDGAASPFGGKTEGPVAAALRPTTSSELHAELVARGYRVEPPRDLARPVDLGSSVREARFSNVSLPPVGLPDLRLFACQHLTRDLVWRPEFLDHPNGVQGVAGLLAVTDDPAVANAYASVFGDRAVLATPGRIDVAVGETQLSLHAPADFADAYPSLAASDLAGFVGVVLSVADITATAARLRSAGFEPAETAGGGLVLPPAATGGAVLEFRSRGR